MSAEFAWYLCGRCGHAPSQHLVSARSEPDPCRAEGCHCADFQVQERPKPTPVLAVPITPEDADLAAEILRNAVARELGAIDARHHYTEAELDMLRRRSRVGFNLAVQLKTYAKENT